MWNYIAIVDRPLNDHQPPGIGWYAVSDLLSDSKRNATCTWNIENSNAPTKRNKTESVAYLNSHANSRTVLDFQILQVNEKILWMNHHFVCVVLHILSHTINVRFHWSNAKWPMLNFGLRRSEYFYYHHLIIIIVYYCVNLNGNGQMWFYTIGILKCYAAWKWESRRYKWNFFFFLFVFELQTIFEWYFFL